MGLPAPFSHEFINLVPLGEPFLGVPHHRWLALHDFADDSAEAHKFAMATLLPAVNAALVALEPAIRSKIEASAPSQAEEMIRHRCVAALGELVQKVGPGWHIRAFGSWENGFAMTGADLDATCFLEGVVEQDARRASREMQEHLLPRLKEHPRFEVIQEVWTARVPILKLRFEQSLEVDLSCHNPQALQNTQLLRKYANLHPIVRDLVIAVKLWAKGEEVCGAFRKHLSSYSLTLMVLYFLQVCAGMPLLPTIAFSRDGLVEDYGWVDGITWNNVDSLPILLFRFFNFYSKRESAGDTSKFAWGEDVVSVRLGRSYHRMGDKFAQLPGQSISRLHIEDPFLLSRNLNCVLGTDEEEELRMKLHDTAMTMMLGFAPSGLCLDVQEIEEQKVADLPNSKFRAGGGPMASAVGSSPNWDAWVSLPDTPARPPMTGPLQAGSASAMRPDAPSWPGRFQEPVRSGPTSAIGYPGPSSSSSSDPYRFSPGLSSHQLHLVRKQIQGMKNEAPQSSDSRHRSGLAGLHDFMPAAAAVGVPPEELAAAKLKVLFAAEKAGVATKATGPSDRRLAGLADHHGVRHQHQAVAPTPEEVPCPRFHNVKQNFPVRV